MQESRNNENRTLDIIVAGILGETVVDISDTFPEEARKQGRYWLAFDDPGGDWPLPEYSGRLPDALDALERFCDGRRMAFSITRKINGRHEVSIFKPGPLSRIGFGKRWTGTEDDIPMAACMAITRAGG